MRGHPEKEDLIVFPPEAYTLDIGAGDGSSGCSVCIDIEPRGENVIRADMLALPFEDCTFDGVLSRCSCFASGDQHRAIDEAMRVLKPGGKLLLSDVFYEEPWFEYDNLVDITEQWREYYFERLWSDDFEDCGLSLKGSPKYYQIVRTKKQWT